MLPRHMDRGTRNENHEREMESLTWIRGNLQILAGCMYIPLGGLVFGEISVANVIVIMAQRKALMKFQTYQSRYKSMPDSCKDVI